MPYKITEDEHEHMYMMNIDSEMYCSHNFLSISWPLIA